MIYKRKITRPCSILLHIASIDRECLHTYSRSSFLSRISNALYTKKLKAPYTHIVQIGDPVLRTPTKPANIDRIGSPEIQNLVQNMRTVLEKYDSFGISAPQLGLPISVFAVQCTNRQISSVDSSVVKSKGMVEKHTTTSVNYLLYCMQ